MNNNNNIIAQMARNKDYYIIIIWNRRSGAGNVIARVRDESIFAPRNHHSSHCYKQ